MIFQGRDKLSRVVSWLGGGLVKASVVVSHSHFCFKYQPANITGIFDWIKKDSVKNHQKLKLIQALKRIFLWQTCLLQSDASLRVTVKLSGS